jgi:chaperone modulatory protein CbpM
MATLMLYPPRRSGRQVPLDTLAREAGMHPDLVRRFVMLGLVERDGGTSASPLFPGAAAALLAKAARLRRDLGIGAVFACELLARIDELEARLRRYEMTDGTTEVMRWTPTG